jgi:hypothetical protein
VVAVEEFQKPQRHRADILDVVTHANGTEPTSPAWKPVHVHNNMSLGYVRNGLDSQFHPAGPPGKTEHGAEPNVLLEVAPMLLLQRVIQYYANVGGSARRRFWIQNKSGVLEENRQSTCILPSQWQYEEEVVNDNGGLVGSTV